MACKAKKKEQEEEFKKIVSEELSKDEKLQHCAIVQYGTYNWYKVGEKVFVDYKELVVNSSQLKQIS